MVIINEDDEQKIIMVDSKTLWARKFSKDTHLGMVTKANTREELDKYYREYVNMPMAQKFKADNMAVRIFGKTNSELYEIYKREFVFSPEDMPGHLDDSTDKNLGIDNDMFSNVDTEINNDIVVRDVDKDTFVGQIREAMYLENVRPEEPTLTNISFFTPMEILTFGEDFYSPNPDNTMLTENISVLDWFKNYTDSFNGFVCENLCVEWSNKIRELYSDFDTILESGDEEKINARKQSILNLGWNPEIEFNENNIQVGRDRLMEAAKLTQDIYTDYTNIIPTEEMALTESLDGAKYSAVYIVLEKGETPIVSDSISFFTNSEYTHAGIAFEPSLSNIYTYNMKRDDNGRGRGFVIEDIKNNKGVTSVFVFFIQKSKVKIMKKQVEDFESHKTTYDFGLLFSKAVNATRNTNISKYNQVCSSFVDTILKTCNIEFIETKNNSIASPADIYNSIMKTQNKVYKIFEGRAKDYKSGRISSLVSKLMNSSDTKAIDESYIEEKAKPNVCYKVSYEGNDIFKELKMAIFDRTRDMNEFEKFKNSKKLEWLNGKEIHSVYLTEKGLKMFNKNAVPTIAIYLDKEKIKVTTHMIDPDKITSRDEYIITAAKKLVKVNESYIEEYYNPRLIKAEYSWVDAYKGKIEHYENTCGVKCVNRFTIDDTDYSSIQKIGPKEKVHNPDITKKINEDTYVLSDPHFTKFGDEADELMIEVFNSVPHNAMLLVLGDISYIKTTDPNNPKVIQNIFKRINHPNMYLILGNHDAMPIEYYYDLGFKGVYDRIYVDSKKWVFSHQYCDGKDPSYTNYHGHIHEETAYVQYISRYDNKINCWIGYCGDKKAKTIKQWNAFDKTIASRKHFLPLHEDLNVMSDEYIVEDYIVNQGNTTYKPYSYIGVFDEEVHDYMESKDMAFNIDRWNNDETNVMFVTGASGSGKSTIAEKVAKEVDGEWIPLDAFFKYAFAKNYDQEFSDWMIESKPTLVSYINMIGRPNIVDHEVSSWDDLEKYPDNVKKSILKLAAYLKSKAPKKFVIEGYQIGRFMKPSDIKNEPLIVKGTTFSKTQFRRVARELSDKNSRGKSSLEKIKNAAKIFRYNVDEYDTWKAEYNHITNFGKDYSKTYHEDTSINEAVSMDDEGNMLIYRATLNTINYGDEIKKSSDLCKLYKESSNLEGLKYELCKLWYINCMLERRIKRNDKHKDDYYGYRRVCLNVFKTYMKHVSTLDDDFNFTAYYNSTPYGGAIRIDKNTLKYSVKALKELLR